MERPEQRRPCVRRDTSETPRLVSTATAGFVVVVLRNTGASPSRRRQRRPGTLAHGQTIQPATSAAANPTSVISNSAMIAIQEGIRKLSQFKRIERTCERQLERLPRVRQASRRNSSPSDRDSPPWITSVRGSTHQCSQIRQSIARDRSLRTWPAIRRNHSPPRRTSVRTSRLNVGNQRTAATASTLSRAVDQFRTSRAPPKSHSRPVHS